MNRNTRRRLWHWTGAHESLFDLDRAQINWFTLFMNEASTHSPQAWPFPA